MSDQPIYFDCHATTPLDPRVLEAMMPYLTEHFGNPGSLHAYGEVALEVVEEARDKIAAAIGSEANEIVFTSGATESNNLAIRGVAERPRRRGDHLVSVVTEHRAVLEPLARLAERGYDITLVEVEPHGSPRAGWVDPVRIEAAITSRTCLVSVMLANNEIGTIHSLAAISEVCRRHGVLLHCDATQGVGKLPVNVEQLGLDLMSFTAHKIYGPKGIGALWVRRRNPTVRLDAQIRGGGQELGRRGGTLNVPGIVGLGEAVRLVHQELSSEMPRLAKLRNDLARQILARVPGTALVGPALDATHPDGTPMRLPGNLSIQFPGVEGQSLMLAMPDLAVSSGATCSSSQPEPSHVLRALGLSDDQVRGCLRFGLGRFTTPEEVSRGVDMVEAAMKKMQEAGGI